MAGFNVLKNWHPMIGCDWHDLMPPGSPTITGKAPHFCFSILMGIGVTAQWGNSTPSHWGWTMKRGTDIGPLIPHFGPPNVLLPLIWAFSGSKSYFGTTRVLAEGKPVAIAILGLAGVNLNCAGPTKFPPVPSDIVLAFTTHQTSITLGNFLADFAQMVFDSALQFGLAQLFNLKFFQVPAAALYEKWIFNGMFNKFLPLLGSGTVMNYLYQKGLVEFLAKGVAIQLPIHIAGLLLGTPVGYSPPFAPIGSGAYGREDKVHDALRDYIDGPNPTWFPNSPPENAAPPAPAPAGSGALPAGSGAPSPAGGGTP